MYLTLWCRITVGADRGASGASGERTTTTLVQMGERLQERGVGVDGGEAAGERTTTMLVQMGV